MIFCGSPLNQPPQKIAGNNSCQLLIWTATKNHNIGVGPLKRSILNIRSIFRIGRLNPADTDNELLVSGGKPIIIDMGYCYQLTPIIDFRCYNKLFF
jgi:hypothetical protein